MTGQSTTEKFAGAKCACGKPVLWVRRTQFAGDHPFCDECARKEGDFGKLDDTGASYFWERIGEAPPDAPAVAVDQAPPDVVDQLAAWLRTRKPANVKYELAAAFLKTLRDERNSERAAASNAHSILELVGRSLREAETERDRLKRTVEHYKKAAGEIQSVADMFVDSIDEGIRGIARAMKNRLTACYSAITADNIEHYNREIERLNQEKEST